MAGGHDTASVPAEVAHIVKGGHQAILANGNDRNWYLNDGYGNGELVLWNAVYALDPLNGTAEFGLTPAQEKLVIGGEASLWGEEIDASNLQQRAWPRGSAFAERMWSPRAVKSVKLAAPRLARQVCKMKARGLGASPIGPGSCLATQSTYIE